tara:strand:- start:117 stop:1052 length:936 start_codon:yes stop_codon:yes gene_type:complete
MKKILSIMFIFLFWCSNIFAESIVKLPKDTSSGFTKFKKSLTGSYYKDYGTKVVDKKDGHPVRHGKKSIRFELRNGDCGKDRDGGWNDCKEDRERHELSANNKKDRMSRGEYWFAWSIYFTKDHKNLFPLSSNYGQFHQHNGEPVFMFKERKDSYSVVRTIGDYDYHERKLIGKNDMIGKWHDILINVKWTKKDDGFFKIWVNNKIKYEYKGPTKSKQYVYYKFGIYRTGITRYLNYKNLEGLEKCLNKNDWPGNTKRIFYILKSKNIGHKNSIKLYNLCKDYYNPVKIPKTVVYFDEVRKSKKKDKVIRY